MRRKLVAGNWKMHGRRASGAALVQAICARMDEFAGVDLWVAPSAVYLAQVSGLLAGSGIGLVAQNVARELDGAFTGEVSAGMLADVGCQAVLVGHSERRSRYGESDAVIAEKFGRVQAVAADWQKAFDEWRPAAAVVLDRSPLAIALIERQGWTAVAKDGGYVLLAPTY